MNSDEAADRVVARLVEVGSLASPDLDELAVDEPAVTVDATPDAEWVARWPDGTVDRAPSAAGLLGRVAADHDVSVPRVKRLLAVRCEAWSGVLPDPLVDDDAFVVHLAELGMFGLSRPA